MTDDNTIGAYYADVETYHVEGIARVAAERGEAGFFRVPLLNHVTGNLWQGGVVDTVRLPDDFKHVVALYRGERYTLGPDTTYDFFHMTDAEGWVDETKVRAVARVVHQHTLTGKTLVHCQAGLNRSGLIAATVLMLEGLTADEAIGLLRERRSPMVLCNESFEKFLRGLKL